MGHINLLDQQTINKIAAGEVVERPAAVVKELVENAIDAGANAVTVEIKDGGISFIRITDNGCGMAPDDIKTAFLRHATSKIKTVEDLLYVSSLGFRGEALSSIASVAFVELVTKTPDSFMGYRYVIEGGKEISLDEVGCPEGTTLIVRNIFYNTPARKKFLKSPTTEAGYINDLMERLSVSHPNISFRFINNNQLKLTTSGNNKLKDIIYHVYGRDVAKALLEVEGQSENASLYGFIGKPVLARGNRNFENYYINGRYIKSPLITKAIEEAYKGYAMSHKYPFTALHFNIDSNFIDVNVHPTKMEVRFSNNEEVYQLVYQNILNRLRSDDLIPELSLTEGVKLLAKEDHTVKERGPEPFEKQRLMTNQTETKSGEYVKADSGRIKESNLRIDSGKRQEPNQEIVKKTLQAMQIAAESDITMPKEVVASIKESIQYKENEEHETMNYQQSALAEQTFDNVPEQLSFTKHFIAPDHSSKYRIVGQVFKTFWIVEFNEKMLLIDQHVVHEKILYEKLYRHYQQRQGDSQMLLPPIVLNLSLREATTLNRYLPLLHDLGYEIEPFGGNDYTVRSVPNDLYNLNEQDVLMELIDHLTDHEMISEPIIILEKLASMSCKAAIKGNQDIRQEEFQALLDELMTLDNPYYCPHGRPIIVSMSKYEIEKKFKRIV